MSIQRRQKLFEELPIVDARKGIRMTILDGMPISQKSLLKSDNNNWDIDHFVPKALGGKSCLNNLSIMLRDNNRKKGCLHPTEYVGNRVHHVIDRIVRSNMPREKKMHMIASLLPPSSKDLS